MTKKQLFIFIITTIVVFVFTFLIGMYISNHGFILKDTSNKKYNTITVTFSNGKGFFLSPEVVQSSEGIKINYYPSDSVLIEFTGVDMETRWVKILFHNSDLFEYNGLILIRR